MFRRKIKKYVLWLEAWLLFPGSDDPEDVIRLIERYPEFKAMYEQVYEIFQNVERVMEVFSKELQELDRNTVRYMIDEMQSEIEKKEEEIIRKDEEINRKNQQIEELQRLIEKYSRQEEKQ